MCFLSCYDDFYHAGVRKYKIICILIYFVSCLSKKKPIILFLKINNEWNSESQDKVELLIILLDFDF